MQHPSREATKSKNTTLLGQKNKPCQVFPNKVILVLFYILSLFIRAEIRDLLASNYSFLLTNPIF